MVPQLPASDADTPTSVYTYYDSQDVLLYVGVTSRGVQRNREHNTSKDWWQFVHRQEVEHFPTRPMALAHETRTIERFRPPFNTHHNPGYEQVRAAYLAFRTMYEARPNPHDEYRALAKRLPLMPHSRDDDGNNTVLQSSVMLATHEVVAAPGARAYSPTRHYGSVGRVWKSGPLVLIQFPKRLPPVISAVATLKLDLKPQQIRISGVAIEVEYDLPTKNDRNRRNRELREMAEVSR